MEYNDKAKISDYQIVFREFPDEVTLAINFSNCPCNCDGCHSSHLKTDTGTSAYLSTVTNLIKKHPEITCVGLMGGDAYPNYILWLGYWIATEFKLKVGWYSGMTRSIEELREMGGDHIDHFTYYKFGPYKKSLGGLDSKTTNQKMLMRNDQGDWIDITNKFRRI